MSPTLRRVMREPRDGDALDGPEMPPSTIVQRAARRVLDSDRPIRVTENGKLLGVVSDDDIMGVVVADDETASSPTPGARLSTS